MHKQFFMRETTIFSFISEEFLKYIMHRAIPLLPSPRSIYLKFANFATHKAKWYRSEFKQAHGNNDVSLQIIRARSSRSIWYTFRTRISAVLRANESLDSGRSLRGRRGCRFLEEGERRLECRTINNKTEFTATGKWRRRTPLHRRILRK